MKRIAIIGGVAAGMSAATQARRRDPNAEIVVFERSTVVSYGMCVLPYFISGEIKSESDLIIYTPEYFRKKRNIDVRIQSEVIEVDTREKYLLVKDLQNNSTYEYDYDRLIIATGARPIIPAPLQNAQNVAVLHNYESALALKKLIQHKAGRATKKAVIIGGGNVGLETAEALAKLGFSVTVIEKERQILPYLSPDIAQRVQEYLATKGISIKTEESMQDAEVVMGQVTKLITDKSVYPADIVVAAVGIRPNTDFLQNSGISLDSRGAIKVDQRQQTSANAVFACGDCCDKYSIVRNRRVYLPLGTHANKEGIIAGDNAAGYFRKNRGITETVVAKLFDLEFGKTGLSLSEAQDYYNVDYVEGEFPLYPREIAKEKIFMRIIYQKDNQKIVGAEMLGTSGISGRLDVISSAIINNMTVQEVADIDFSYTPRLKPVRDPLLQLVLRTF